MYIPVTVLPASTSGFTMKQVVLFKVTSTEGNENKTKWVLICSNRFLIYYG